MAASEMTQLHKVLVAAESVLLALERYISATTPQASAKSQGETFIVEDGALVHRVNPASGKSYTHRCKRDAFEVVAAAVAQISRKPFNLDDVRRRARVPHSQASVAIAFLKTRGRVVPTNYRRCVAAPGFTFKNAMTEYHALAAEA